jgi:septal ring factor EnvC (AmiA/AmiB activator)
MKKLLVLIFITINFFNAYSQESLYDRLEKRAVEIDSLEKRLESSKTSFIQLSNTIKTKNDEIIDLRNKVTRLSSYKPLKKTNDSLLLQYQKLNKIKDKLITIHQNDLNKAKAKAKNEIYSKIADTYTNINFESLILISSKSSVDRDSNLLFKNQELKQTFKDLKNYFEAKALLSSAYDAAKVQTALNNLNSINHTSASLDKLKLLLTSYKTNYKGLEDCFERILSLNKNVNDLSDEIRSDKIKDNNYEISTYIFGFDINFNDYPYISKVVNNAIVTKHGNNDVNISNLLK